MLNFFFIKTLLLSYKINQSKSDVDNSTGSMKVASLWFGGRQATGHEDVIDVPGLQLCGGGQGLV